MVKPVSTKNTKISWPWWHMPVIPATQEAEAGKSLEPGSRRVPLHSSLVTRARICLNKTKAKQHAMQRSEMKAFQEVGTVAGQLMRLTTHIISKGSSNASITAMPGAG